MPCANGVNAMIFMYKLSVDGTLIIYIKWIFMVISIIIIVIIIIKIIIIINNLEYEFLLFSGNIQIFFNSLKQLIHFLDYLFFPMT